MIALVVVALVLSGPPKRCVTACFERGPVWECYFDEYAQRCPAHLTECPTTRKDVVCKPRVVSLGRWDVVEMNRVPTSFTDHPAGRLNQPGPFGEYPLEKPAP